MLAWPRFNNGSRSVKARSTYANRTTRNTSDSSIRATKRIDRRILGNVSSTIVTSLCRV